MYERGVAAFAPEVKAWSTSVAVGSLCGVRNVTSPLRSPPSRRRLGKNEIQKQDRIIALPISEHHWHVCLAEHDRTGRLKPSHRDSILAHRELLRARYAPRARKACCVVVLLD